MSQPLDLSQFPDLPPEVVTAISALQFELSVERAARQHEQAVVAEKEVFITELKALIEKLEGQVQDYRRTKFGPKSEKLDPAQLELALEDLETAIAETQAQIAAVEERIAASEPDPEKRQPRAPRKARALPEGLPRVERVVEPDNIICPCGCGDMVRIGEDRSERLDYIPARYQVIVTVRPKYACPKARTLAEAEVLWSDRKYDLLVLDVSLPDGSGFDFCQKVRRTSNVPILFLTASDEEMNIIMGLELGGDDYLTKPFKLGVLLSRVNALLRRANASSAGEPVLESGSITVRLLQGQAYKNGILLELTGAEYKLLCFFLQHPNAVLSKEQILDALWDCDGDYIDSSALTVYIRRLRMKIEDDPGKPQMLLTVRGMGYKWNG